MCAILELGGDFPGRKRTPSDGSHRNVIIDRYVGDPPLTLSRASFVTRVLDLISFAFAGGRGLSSGCRLFRGSGEFWRARRLFPVKGFTTETLSRRRLSSQSVRFECCQFSRLSL